MGMCTIQVLLVNRLRPYYRVRIMSRTIFVRIYYYDAVTPFYLKKKKHLDTEKCRAFVRNYLQRVPLAYFYRYSLT